MNVTELHAKASRLERELREVHELLRRESCGPEAFTAQLVQTRAFAFDAAGPVKEVVDGCVDSLSRLGFCVIDNVIPESRVDDIREEVVAAEATISRNLEAIRGYVGDGQGGRGTTTSEDDFEVRSVRRVGHPPKPPNDILWMPQYARYLAGPVVTAVARRVLDDHLRIAQLHPRTVKADVDRTPGGYGPTEQRGNANHRGWHTDWPHDLSAYGMGDPLENVGCVRQPFPDVAMCLVMIWYLTDVDGNSGGTWTVPGSHRDKRNPRGPSDGIMVSAPIPGDMQITAKAGSVDRRQASFRFSDNCFSRSVDGLCAPEMTYRHH